MATNSGNLTAPLFMSNRKLGKNDIYLIALYLITKCLAETVDCATLS